MNEMSSTSLYKYPFREGFVDNDRMMKLLTPFWKLNRTAVSEDTDKLALHLKKYLDGELLEAKSGSKCLTWIMPKRWHVKKATLKDTAGNVIVDYKDNPLTVWTNSVSIKKTVSRQELEKHLATSKEHPDQIPFHYSNGFKYGVEDWGFSLPYNVYEQLTDEEYSVEIDSLLDDNGSVKVVHKTLPGKRKETILIMAHTCHPAQVADGIANIAIALELYEKLKKQKSRQYTYRFIFGPEYFAAAAYLHHTKKGVRDNIVGGYYLDFLSSNEVIGMQHSRQEDSVFDKVSENVMKTHTTQFLRRRFKELCGNDELFYNGPGFNIPVIGISRETHREYHLSSDNLENASTYKMNEGAWIMHRILTALESNFVPLLQYTGPLYLSGNGIDLPMTLRRKAADIEYAADGQRSCIEIAHDLKLDVFDVIKYFEQLEEKGFVKRI